MRDGAAEYIHAPVMLDPVVHALAPLNGGVYVDGTLGGGGYARAILGAANCRVIGVDRDPAAIRSARQWAPAYGGRLSIVEAAYSGMEEVCAAAGVAPGGLDGVVLDLGVSSVQLDHGERGFSFSQDGPLDMRMSGAGASARDVVANAPEDLLANILYDYGEEKQSRKIARAIVKAREDAPIETTGALASIIERAAGSRGGSRIHPATRSFQALRIFVNDELGELARGLAAAERLLRPSGRLVVVSFHSLEDRIVKTFLNAAAGKDGGGSRHLPAPESAPPTFRLLHSKPETPDADEIASNPRARSAKLRAAIRTSEPPPASPRAGWTSRLPSVEDFAREMRL